MNCKGFRIVLTASASSSAGVVVRTRLALCSRAPSEGLLLCLRSAVPHSEAWCAYRLQGQLELKAQPLLPVRLWNKACVTGPTQVAAGTTDNKEGAKASAALLAEHIRMCKVAAGR